MSAEKPEIVRAFKAHKGLCQCGCGDPAPIAARTRRKKGHIKGEPIKFISGHRRTRPVSDRLWEKVDKSGDCWLWLASKNPLGYGDFRIDGRTHRAHRVAFELVRGPIPAGLVLDHLCRVPACVNPDHLEPVPLAENTRRGLKTYALRSTCKRGHDISNPEKVKTRPDGRRECRICAREQYKNTPSARRRARKEVAA